MTSMTSTIKRSARLSFVAIAAVSAMAGSAAAADAATRISSDTSPRTSILIAAPAPDPGTNGKETCVGSGRQCGPGSRFHAACDALHGGYEGSNPDPTYNIPQTWSCNVP